MPPQIRHDSAAELRAIADTSVATLIVEDGLVDRPLGRPLVNLIAESSPWSRFLFAGYYTPLHC